jgi:hypothetical protein
LPRNEGITGGNGDQPFSEWATIHSTILGTPFMVNFSCDLRLTAEARISIHPKNTVCAAE